MKFKNCTLEELPNVRILGRTTSCRNPATLFWTASGIELQFTGEELWLCLYADYENMEPWVSVELNGVWISRFPVPRGDSKVCLFRGMAGKSAKHIRVLKETQAMNADPRHLLQVTGLMFDTAGEFLTLPLSDIRLEFIGDSITSGEGAIGAKTESDWASAFFSAERSYPHMVADILNAEYRVFSQSGWGILAGWDNDIRHRIPSYYERVCGLAEGSVNASLGAQERNDFASWQPDAVIINLGTNDDGAYHNAPWIDPETGVLHQLRLDSEGHPVEEDAGRLVTEVAKFCALVRRYNPNAVILWTYGMLGDFLRPLLEQGVAQAKEAGEDEKIFFLPLTNTTEETVGARKHPGEIAHMDAAREISSWLKRYWNY